MRYYLLIKTESIHLIEIYLNLDEWWCGVEGFQNQK